MQINKFRLINNRKNNSLEIARESLMFLEKNVQRGINLTNKDIVIKEQAIRVKAELFAFDSILAR